MKQATIIGDYLNMSSMTGSWLPLIDQEGRRTRKSRVATLRFEMPRLNAWGAEAQLCWW